MYVFSLPSTQNVEKGSKTQIESTLEYHIIYGTNIYIYIYIYGTYIYIWYIYIIMVQIYTYTYMLHIYIYIIYIYVCGLVQEILESAQYHIDRANICKFCLPKVVHYSLFHPSRNRQVVDKYRKMCCLSSFGRNVGVWAFKQSMHS